LLVKIIRYFICVKIRYLDKQSARGIGGHETDASWSKHLWRLWRSHEAFKSNERAPSFFIWRGRQFRRRSTVLDLAGVTPSEAEHSSRPGGGDTIGGGAQFSTSRGQARAYDERNREEG